MNDSKIRDKYRNKYHDFINKEIIPTANKTLLDNGKITLSAYNDAGDVIGINAVLVSLKQDRLNSNQLTMEYTSDEGYYSAFGDQVNDYMRRVKVSNQSSFFDFIAVCADKDKYEFNSFEAKEELFKYLTRLIDDKRYVNQRRAAFEPSKFPEMSVWRQSRYYEFVDSKFKQLFKDESPKFVNGYLVPKQPGEESDIRVTIIGVDPKQRFIRFRVEENNKEHVYTSNSKYYKRAKSQQEVTFTKIENNNPNFMHILRCVNKDKPAQSKEFKQKALSAYFDGFISNDKYKNEYDITFVPVEVNPGVDESLREEYVDFIQNEVKPKIKNMWMVSADDDSVFFAQHYGALTVMRSEVDNTPEHEGADVVLTPNSKLNSYRKKSGQEVYGIPNDNPNFKFMRECLSHNGTESKWIKFMPTKEEYRSGNNKDLLHRLEELPFNQQCKEDYLNIFHPELPQSIGQDGRLPALLGSSNNAVSIASPPIAQQAVFVTWLAFMLRPVLGPVFDYIVNKISGQNHTNDKERKKKSNDKPLSCVTGASALSSQSLDKAL